ncbi:Protein naked cuticle [Sergentomyia squamirostris]
MKLENREKSAFVANNGSKQNGVLQESATDSEELIYPMRAPSSCSAPPDLLLTSDREAINSGLMASTPNHHISSTQQQSLKMTNRRESSPANVTASAAAAVVSGGGGGSHHHKSHHQKAPLPAKSPDDDRVHLEEFHCDVSLEHQGKIPQPVQFSFTLYDLDGHGKITKDDIAGIVSTIYESLGKSIVVPHYGSKTINVRLTVSPDAKMKTPTKKAALINSRRRYRPRKLISDDEGSDTSHDNVPIKLSPKTTNARSKSHCSHHHSTQQSQKFTKETNHQQPKDCSTTDSGQEQNVVASKANFNEDTPHVYESINNLKWCSKANNILQQGNNNNPSSKKTTNCLEILDNKLAENDPNNECTGFCRECSLVERYNLEGGMPVTKQRRRVLRKSRSRKHKIEGASRVRSLSVGNENCLINREKSEEECWKSSMQRRELIEIIRESMEKNRLCFQGNRKPTTDSPRYRQRSHTINDQCVDMPARLENSPAMSPDIVPTNLCGYDSFLHATICSNLNNNIQFTPTVAPAAIINAAGGTPVRNNSGRMARNRALRQQEAIKVGNPMGYMRLQATTKAANTTTPKATNNKGVESKKLISSDSHALKAKTKSKIGRLQRSKSKEELFTCRDNTPKIEDILNADVFMNKLKITEEVAEKCVESPRKNVQGVLKSPVNQAKSPSKGLFMEYASIPVNADPAECENLLKSPVSEGDDTKMSDPSSSTVHRYVHEHIHHHYHHFEEATTSKI